MFTTSPPSRPEPSNGSSGDLPLSLTWPRVGVIIVNYNGRDDTLQCLRSLAGLTYPGGVDIIVVDQPAPGGRDGTPEIIREQFPTVHVIENDENTGFAGGSNVGIRAALARGALYLFLLNNDTEVEPGLLEPLVARAEGDPKIGVVGPTMLYHARPDTVWSAGGRIDWRGQSLLLGEGEKASALENTNEAREVDFIVGCGLLVKRSVLEAVGLLDERYFLYFEETDMCARARKAGWRVLHEPRARLWHKVSQSTGEDSPLTLYYMRRNQLLYLGEHGERPLLGRLAALHDTLRLACVWTLQRKTQRRDILLRAIRDYFGGRFGKADL